MMQMKENINPIKQLRMSANNRRAYSKNTVQQFLDDVWPSLSAYSDQIKGYDFKSRKNPSVTLKRLSKKEIRAAKAPLRASRSSPHTFLLPNDDLPDLEFLMNVKDIVSVKDENIDTEVLEKIPSLKDTEVLTKLHHLQDTEVLGKISNHRDGFEKISSSKDTKGMIKLHTHKDTDVLDKISKNKESQILERTPKHNDAKVPSKFHTHKDPVSMGKTSHKETEVIERFYCFMGTDALEKSTHKETATIERSHNRKDSKVISKGHTHKETATIERRHNSIDCKGVTKDHSHKETATIKRSHNRIDSKGIIKDHTHKETATIEGSHNRMDSKGITTDHTHKETATIERSHNRMDSKGITKDHTHKDKETPQHKETEDVARIFYQKESESLQINPNLKDAGELKKVLVHKDVFLNYNPSKAVEKPLESTKPQVILRKDEVKELINEMRVKKWTNADWQRDKSPKKQPSTSTASLVPEKPTSNDFITPERIFGISEPIPPLLTNFKNKPSPFVHLRETTPEVHNKKISKRKHSGDKQPSKRSKIYSELMEDVHEAYKKVQENHVDNKHSNPTTNLKNLVTIPTDVLYTYTKSGVHLKTEETKELSKQKASNLAKTKEHASKLTYVKYLQKLADKSSQTTDSYQEAMSTSNASAQTLDIAKKLFLNYDKETANIVTTGNFRKTIDGTSQTSTVVITGENFDRGLLEVATAGDNSLLLDHLESNDPVNLFNTMKVVKALTEKFKQHKDCVETEKENVMKKVRTKYDEKLLSIGGEIKKQETLFFNIMNASLKRNADKEMDDDLRKEIAEALTAYKPKTVSKNISGNGTESISNDGTTLFECLSGAVQNEPHKNVTVSLQSGVMPVNIGIDPCDSSTPQQNRVTVSQTPELIEGTISPTPESRKVAASPAPELNKDTASPATELNKDIASPSPESNNDIASPYPESSKDIASPAPVSNNNTVLPTSTLYCDEHYASLTTSAESSTSLNIDSPHTASLIVDSPASSHRDSRSSSLNRDSPALQLNTDSSNTPPMPLDLTSAEQCSQVHTSKKPRPRRIGIIAEASVSNFGKKEKSDQSKSNKPNQVSSSEVSGQKNCTLINTGGPSGVQTPKLSDLLADPYAKQKVVMWQRAFSNADQSKNSVPTPTSSPAVNIPGRKYSDNGQAPPNVTLMNPMVSQSASSLRNIPKRIMPRVVSAQNMRRALPRHPSSLPYQATQHTPRHTNYPVRSIQPCNSTINNQQGVGVPQAPTMPLIMQQSEQFGQQQIATQNSNQQRLMQQIPLSQGQQRNLQPILSKQNNSNVPTISPHILQLNTMQRPIQCSQVQSVQYNKQIAQVSLHPQQLAPVQNTSQQIPQIHYSPQFLTVQNSQQYNINTGQISHPNTVSEMNPTIQSYARNSPQVYALNDDATSQVSPSNHSLRIQSVVGGVNENEFEQSSVSYPSPITEPPVYVQAASGLPQHMTYRASNQTQSAAGQASNPAMMYSMQNPIGLIPDQSTHGTVAASVYTQTLNQFNVAGHSSTLAMPGPSSGEHHSPHPDVIMLNSSPDLGNCDDISPITCFLCGMDAQFTCCGPFRYCSADCKQQDSERHKAECKAK